MSNTEAVFISKVIESNRITIPKHIAELLKLSKGDFVAVKIIKVIKKQEVVSSA